MKREILFYGKFFQEFYSRQEKKTQRKIDYVLDLIRNIDRVPAKFFKHLEDTDGLYEIRVSAEAGNIRIFSFFDEGKLIILLNCFIKKTAKTPFEEIDHGMRLKKQYFEEKIKRKK